MEMAAKDAVELQGKNKIGIQYVQQENKQSYQGSREQKCQQTQSCPRCGDSRHSPTNYKFKNVDCHGCGKRGHIKRVCQSNKRNAGRSSRYTKDVHKAEKEGSLSENNDSDPEYEASYLKINSIQSEKSDPLLIELKIDNKNVKMEIDTGSEISVMSKREFESCWGKRKLNQLNSTKTILRTFSGEKIKPLGIAKVKVEYQGQKKHLNLFVVDKGMSTLLGRSWSEKLPLNWKEPRKVVKVETVDPQKANSCKTPKGNIVLDELLTKYESVFGDKIGKVKGNESKPYFQGRSKTSIL